MGSNESITFNEASLFMAMDNLYMEYRSADFKSATVFFCQSDYGCDFINY